MQNEQFQFEDYEIEEQIGDSIGGILFRGFRRAENAGLGRRDLIYRGYPALAQDVNALDLIKEQLAASAGITHANLFSSIRCTIYQEQLFLVSEWLPAVRLSALADRMADANEKWPVPVALYLATEIAKVLCHLQTHGGTAKQKGLVYSQVRPENIFITFDGQVKLMSMGMAAAENAALLNRNGHVDGMPNYASPEQAMGREIDGRSDLFSLGVLLWSLLSGRPLFPPSSRKEWLRVLTEKTPPPLSQSIPDAPAELDSVAAKLLDRDMYVRYELGERAAQDMGAVLKFRFPEFTAADFATFCAKQTSPERGKFEAFLAQNDDSQQVTREIPSNPSVRTLAARARAEAESEAPADDQPGELVQNPSADGSFARAKAPARTQISLEKPAASLPTLKIAPVEVPRPNVIEEGIIDWLLSSWMKPALAICVTALVLLPFAGPRVLKQVRAQRALAQKNKAKAHEPKATLHLISNEPDFELKIDGKTVLVVDDTVVVPANRELLVTAEKEGFEDIETVTQAMADEDLDLPLTFKKGSKKLEADRDDDEKPAKKAKAQAD